MQTIRLAFVLTAAFTIAAPGRAQLVVSANDNKQVLVDGVPKAAANPAPDTAALIDLSQSPPKVIAEIDVPTASPAGPPASAAITPDESIALISGGMKIDPADPTKIAPDNRICVIDLKSTPPKVLGTVEVGAQPCGIGITPDGKLALVANRSDGTVSVLSISGQTVTKIDTIKLGDEKSGPSGIAITPDGKTALVTRDGDHFVSVLVIDNGKVQAGKRDITVGLRPYGATMHPSGRFAVVANVGRGAGDTETLSVIDLSQNPPRAVDTIAAGQTPECPAFSADGKFLGVVVMNGSNKPKSSPFYNDAGKLMVFGVAGMKLTKLAEAPIGHWSQGVVFSKNGKTLLVQNMVEKDLWVFSFNGKNLKDTGQRIKVKGGAASIGIAGVR
jgi:DNA-binding beta-propeller fold protein YncE